MSHSDRAACSGADRGGSMSRCRIIRAVQVSIVIATLAGSAAAHAEVAVGASFGYTHLSYSIFGQHPSNDVVAVPGSEAWEQPGLRVGYLPSGRRWDLNADLGLAHRSGTIGNDETVLELLPQAQVNGRGQGGFSPFVNGGVG